MIWKNNNTSQSLDILKTVRPALLSFWEVGYIFKLNNQITFVNILSAILGSVETLRNEPLRGTLRKHR